MKRVLLFSFFALCSMWILLLSAPRAHGQTLQVRYAMDDKYADPTPKQLNKWIIRALSRPCQNEDFLLQGEGGGPEGAEWNPSTDLIFFVYDAPNVEELYCLLQGEWLQLNWISKKDAFAVILPFETWIEALKTSENESAEATQGGAFELQLHFGDHALKYSFNAAFGE